MVGERIRLLRKERNMTLRELADELGIAFTTLGNYERGDREPELEFIFKVAKYFSVSVDYITGYKDVRNYDEFLLMNDFNNISEVLNYAEPETKKILLNMFQRLTALTFDIPRSKNYKEAELLNQIIESTFNIKNGLGLGVIKVADNKFEYAKRFLKEKEKIDKSYNSLLEIYTEK